MFPVLLDATEFSAACLHIVFGTYMEEAFLHMDSLPLARHIGYISHESRGWHWESAKADMVSMIHSPIVKPLDLN